MSKIHAIRIIVPATIVFIAAIKYKKYIESNKPAVPGENIAKQIL